MVEKTQKSAGTSLEVFPKVALPETANTAEVTYPGLIVEDSAELLEPGQMRRSEFLAELHAAVCRSAEEALAGTEWTTGGCPYLNDWFAYYSRKDSRHIERAIRRYAPETLGVSAARDYIPFITPRVRHGIETWARTGEITGVPEIGTVIGITGTSVPAAGISFTNSNNITKGISNPRVILAQLGSGQVLENGVRSRMESVFGMDFSRVRVHTDTTAAKLSDKLNAFAFTVGEHVAFGTGEYKPGTLIGDALIAHELAHVVQQGVRSADIRPLQMAGINYNAFEEDADKSALGAIVSLWGSAKGGLTEIARNVIPQLRSGLRLSRCNKEKEKKEKAKPVGVTRAADIKCEPEPKTLDEIQKLRGGAAHTVLGFTKPAPASFHLNIIPEGGKCKLDLKDEPRLSFSHFVYVRPGDYKIGTVKIPFDPCKDKVGDFYYRITPEMAEKIKAGEIEHCEDFKLAFTLSYEQYTQAVKEVTGTDVPGKDVKSCESEVYKRLTAKTGIEVSKWGSVANCLIDKTLERDKEWHKVTPPEKGGEGTYELNEDCSRLIFVFDHIRQLTEINKYLPEDVVKGCGEKRP
ncbi:MAG: eCIS core domain-containing protein [Candidatus Loosdrechtia sp.]|uniref:eCIS core domain-containing protein n=1 Tax=Candidatus Loosdrechtia sp. TaxID=3101272 RepID=UPI003A61FDCF|nr:MAG: DUF4157 domain-containing protein [Candidatus Jettenia sp. AMX2]